MLVSVRKINGGRGGGGGTSLSQDLSEGEKTAQELGLNVKEKDSGRRKVRLVPTPTPPHPTHTHPARASSPRKVLFERGTEGDIFPLAPQNSETGRGSTWCLTATETTRLIRDGEKRGGVWS